MTVEEAIKQFEFDRDMILFDPSTGEEISPEMLKLINKENYLTYAADGVAIEALKEVQKYQEIGTVEECREAVEKQRTKKTHIVTNEFLGGTSYVCPNCGAEMMLIDRNRIQWGRMQKYCGCCGQAIDENLEGM